MNPEIYLLDEPSSNLDMASIQELKEHLRLIKSQGKTILIAEHRLYYLMELADSHCLSGRWRNSKDFHAGGISPAARNRTGTHGAAGG